MKKPRNIRTIMALSVTLFALSLPAYAGGIDGGGGQGVVCPQQSGGNTVELLDLWESRVYFHRPVPSASGASVRDIVNSAFESLKNVVNEPYQPKPDDYRTLSRPLQSWVRDEALLIAGDSAYANINPITEGQLTLTPDAYEEIKPETCPIKQIVKYKDVGGPQNILMNVHLRDAMDATNQAALGLHESLYSELRRYGESNSIRVRRAVGYVMSGGSFEPLQSFLAEPHITCTSRDENTKFHIAFSRMGTSGFWGIVPERIQGRLMMGLVNPSAGFGQESTVEDFFKTLGRGHDWASVINSNYSPVDFDTQYRFEVSPKGPSIQLLMLAGQKFSGAKIKVNCQIVK